MTAAPGSIDSPLPYGPPLTLDRAKKMMVAAEAEAVRNGWPVAIVIVDSAGGEGLRFLAVPGVTPLEGGFPIVVDNRIVGAIGVSGVLSRQDVQVAQAGLAAL